MVSLFSSIYVWIWQQGVHDLSHSQLPVLFSLTDRASPSLAAKNVINLISVMTVWWCPCVGFHWKKVFALISAFSWQNSISLWPASLCISRPNLPVTPGISGRRQWHPVPVLLPGKIPWMEEPGRLQSIRSLRIGHDWATSLSLFTFMHWRRKWQPTPVFLPGESQGWGSLVGCCLWGRTELDTTEVT